MGCSQTGCLSMWIIPCWWVSCSNLALRYPYNPKPYQLLHHLLDAQTPGNPEKVSLPAGMRAPGPVIRSWGSKNMWQLPQKRACLFRESTSNKDADLLEVYYRITLALKQTISMNAMQSVSCEETDAMTCTEAASISRGDAVLYYSTFGGPPARNSGIIGL